VDCSTATPLLDITAHCELECDLANRRHARTGGRRGSCGVVARFEGCTHHR
jgi:hypothetical protein